MKIWLNIPSADAIRLALPKAGAVAIDVDLATLTPEERLLLIEHTLTRDDNDLPKVIRMDGHPDERGVCSIGLSSGERRRYGSWVVTPKTLDQAGLLESLREREQQLEIERAEVAASNAAREARLASERAERDAAHRADVEHCRALLSTMPFADQVTLRHNTGRELRWADDAKTQLSGDCSGRGGVAWTDVCTDADLAVLDREISRLADERRATEGRREVERLSAIATLVTRHGTESQRRRLAEGLLPDPEITTLLRCVALDPIKASLYVKLTQADIEHDDRCGDCADPRFKAVVEEVDGGISADEYSALLALRAQVEAALPGLRDALPDAMLTQTLRQHRGWCDCEDSGGVERRGLLVTVQWRGLEASREYALVPLSRESPAL